MLSLYCYAFYFLGGLGLISALIVVSALNAVHRVA
jgi:NADH:ubiquinone oxidoreductase subunit 6 (subunit J)